MADEESVEVYKTYEDGYVVRSLRKSEVHIINTWYCAMGVTPEDDLMITRDVFPQSSRGFYVGEYEGNVVASCVRLHWGGNNYYGSLYYCDSSYRRQRFGTRLRDDVARSHIGNGVLYVDAVEGFVANTNINRFGYIEMYKTIRYEGDARDVESNCNVILKNVSEVPFSTVVDYDNKCFISKDYPVRRQFLQRLSAISGGAAYVATDDMGTVIGLGCRRPAIQKGHHLVGPLYADSFEIAKAILAKLCKDVIGDRITINIWQPNSDAVALVEYFKCQEIFTVRRQYLNGPAAERNPAVFGVTCLDVCGF